MKMDHARTLLDRIPALQHPCDLDLLVFFAKHLQILMSSDQLAQLLGYKLNEIARSLDALIVAGFLTRTQNPVRLARMYVFATDGTNGAPLSAVVEFASTREGRLALRRALTLSSAGGTDGPSPHGGDDATATAGARPVLTGREPKTNQAPSDEQQRRKR